MNISPPLVILEVYISKTLLLDWRMTFDTVTEDKAKDANWSVGHYFGIVKRAGALRRGG